MTCAGGSTYWTTSTTRPAVPDARNAIDIAVEREIGRHDEREQRARETP